MRQKTKLEFGLIAIAILISVIATLKAAYAWADCTWYGYQTERDTRYAFGVGCMANVKDQWVPRNELRMAQ